MSRLPSVFISHGSPQRALQAGAAGEAWAALGRSLPKPRALLIASAHWTTNLPILTGGLRPETIHDFFGYPKPLYRPRYPAPGSPELAQRARALLRNAGFAAGIDGLRGLDHAAWAPLIHAYPLADVPVVELSVQPSFGPRHHLAVGKALRELSVEGVLIVGSGHLTHNLADVDPSAEPMPAAYVRDFQQFVFDRLVTRDIEALTDYRERSLHGARAHPTDEHFLPFFVALGAAADDAKAQRICDHIDAGALAMDAYVFK